MQIAGLREEIQIARVRPQRREPCVRRRPRGLALLVLVGLVCGDDRRAHKLLAEVRVQYQPIVLREQQAHPAALALGGLRERQLEVEDVAGVDRAVPDQFDQLGQEAAHRGGPSVEVGKAPEQLHPGQRDAVTDADEGRRARRPA